MFRYAVICAWAVGLICGEQAYAQSQDESDDLADIYRLIQDYTKYEDEGRIYDQANLMVMNRTSISGSGKRTSNETWIKVQAAAAQNLRMRFPGLEYHREVRGLEIRKYGDMAVAFFEWYANMIIPVELTDEQVEQIGPPPMPVYVTHVLIKAEGKWKIFHSHFSPSQ